MTEKIDKTPQAPTAPAQSPAKVLAEAKRAAGETRALRRQEADAEYNATMAAAYAAFQAATASK